MKKTVRWHKSSYSGNQGNCVETALDRQAARVRDTKAREHGTLDVTTDAWRALLNRM